MKDTILNILSYIIISLFRLSGNKYFNRKRTPAEEACTKCSYLIKECKCDKK